MDYSFDYDALTWPLNENSLLKLQSYLADEKLENRTIEQSYATVNSEPFVTVCEEPTYMNICYEQQSQMSYHFGDRFKGLFLYLRETTTKKTAITSLQQHVETVLNSHSNCDLAIENDEQFSRDIVTFATMIDNRLRQIRRISEQQFNMVSTQLTKLEKKQRTRNNPVLSLGVLRKLFRRFFMGKKP